MNLIWRSLVSAKLYRIGFAFVLIATLYLMFDNLQAVPAGFKINDKLAHGITFFMLALLLSRGFPDKYDYKFAIGLVLFGLAVEGIQYVIPWRSFSIADWIADIAGVMVYHILHLIRVRFVRVSRSHKDV